MQCVLCVCKCVCVCAWQLSTDLSLVPLFSKYHLPLHHLSPSPSLSSSFSLVSSPQDHSLKYPLQQKAGLPPQPLSLGLLVSSSSPSWFSQLETRAPVQKWEGLVFRKLRTGIDYGVHKRAWLTSALLMYFSHLLLLFPALEQSLLSFSSA